MFFWFLILALLIAAAVWFVRHNDRSRGELPPFGRHSSDLRREADTTGDAPEITAAAR